jgi:hypothetical protein
MNETITSQHLSAQGLAGRPVAPPELANLLGGLATR